MNLVGREFSSETFCPAVRHQMHRVTTRSKLVTQGLRRKQMPAGPTSSKHDNAFHIPYSAGAMAPERKRLRSWARFSGLWRVSAKMNPAVTHMAICEEPP
jgi:hypothetical protein